MRFSSLAPLVVLTLTAACTEPFQARVARFQSLPAPQGQTFTIQSHDAHKAGGLEFATYASLVSHRLEAVGYRPAADPRSATLVVNFDYAVTNPRERIETRPGFGYGFGPYGYGGFGYGGFYGRRWGYGGFGYGGFGYGGWGGFGDYPEVYSQTIYNSHVDLRINRTVDNVSVFEGRAETVATTNDLTKLVPNLITAVFTNFPGNSGQTIRVQIDRQHPDGVTRVGA